MASNHKIQKKWIENFGKCPLVNRELETFNKHIAWQLFYGKKDESYPTEYPSGFKAFHDTSFSTDRETAIETILKNLNFIGIRLSKSAVLSHLEIYPADYHNLLKKCFYIFKTLAHRPENFNIRDPYADNFGDITFLIRIETGQTQLSMFEDLNLPELYNKYVKIPDGYENDEIVKNLFERVERSTESFFITGKAGTGKSTFIHYFTQKTGKKVLLMAFTGIAAINVGGVTIHSFFRFPFRALLPGDEEIKIFEEYDQKRKIIEETDTIVIDEISMLRADILQAIDYSLRNNGGDHHSLFGGKQIIFVGDIFQLPPITNANDEVEKYLFNECYNSPYFFDCDAYQQLKPVFFEFKKSQRQKEDLEFVELLDKVRTCNVDQPSLDKLNERYNPAYIPKPEDFAITLTTNNDIANTENYKKLNELPFTKYEFVADAKGDFDEEKFPTNRMLELKKNAQVIFIKNDGQRRWVNGTIGRIEFIAQDIIEVRLPNGSVHKIEKETWDHRGYKYDRTNVKVTSEAKGTFTQYPIKLAWAITIHKSQGLTFDNVIIDLGSGAFVNGQLYTALSRCRKLSGITLRRKIRLSDIIHDRRLIEFYSKIRDLAPAF